MESIEKARDIRKYLSDFDVSDCEEAVKMANKYEQAISDQRGEIIDAVVEILKEELPEADPQAKYWLAKIIQAIEKLRR
jgi:hypothetical protein